VFRPGAGAENQDVGVTMGVDCWKIWNLRAGANNLSSEGNNFETLTSKKIDACMDHSCFFFFFFLDIDRRLGFSIPEEI